MPIGYNIFFRIYRYLPLHVYHRKYNITLLRVCGVLRLCVPTYLRLFHIYAFVFAAKIPCGFHLIPREYCDKSTVGLSCRDRSHV